MGTIWPDEFGPPKWGGEMWSTMGSWSSQTPPQLILRLGGGNTARPEKESCSFLQNFVGSVSVWIVWIHWLEHFITFLIFPYSSIGKNHPNWLIFFRGVEATKQIQDSCLRGWRFWVNQRRDETSVVVWVRRKGFRRAPAKLSDCWLQLFSNKSQQMGWWYPMYPNVFPTFKRGVAQSSDVLADVCIEITVLPCRSCFLSWHDMKSWCFGKMLGCLGWNGLTSKWFPVWIPWWGLGSSQVKGMMSAPHRHFSTSTKH